ncbi:MAG: DUF1460 domain-containing protein [Bacteroidales bacterium]|nr:DUF1460 domain-containing protein [Bacteroidales bacterium]MDD3989891.1 DUF1460 domain-containing protein [Bacteroidales bacterium]
MTTLIALAQPEKLPLPQNSTQAKSQTIHFEKKDKEIFDKYTVYIKEKANLPTGELIIESAKFFLGTPYVAHTLEIEPECLVINLRELDCTTFLETVYALAMTVRSGEVTFENYCNKLCSLRYRDVVINDYTDRLHYTSDWVYTNEKKGLINTVVNVSGSEPANDSGFEQIRFNLNIMSSRPDLYKQLQGNEKLIEKVKAREVFLSSLTHYYLPTGNIEGNTKLLKNGDMVAFVTSIPGIDISHVGIICFEGDKLTFIHASSSLKKVVTSEIPLTGYLLKNPKNTGIIVARAAF